MLLQSLSTRGHCQVHSYTKCNGCLNCCRKFTIVHQALVESTWRGNLLLFSCTLRIRNHVRKILKKQDYILSGTVFKISSVSPSCSDFWLLYGMMIMLCCWDLSTNINIILLPFVESQSGIHQYFFLYQQQIWIPQLGALFLPHLESVPHCVELIWLILTWNTPTWSFWLLWPPLTA